MKKIRILVVCHKPVKIITDDLFIPIHVGRSNSIYKEEMSEMVGDDTGENISNKNSQYCELTALYWGWKNIHDVKYLGICHYRRFFDKALNDETVEKYFEKYDIIVVKSKNLMKRSERIGNIIHMTTQEDFYLFLDVLLSIYPNYKEKILQFCYRYKKNYPYTMFVAPKQVYDKFCEFIFPVLFKFEEKKRSHGYTRQNRAIAYFGEWSLALFIFIKDLKVNPVPIYYTEENRIQPNLFRRYKEKIISSLYGFFEMLVKTPNDFKVPNYVSTGLKLDGIELETLE